jgi:hypothetical protein
MAVSPGAYALTFEKMFLNAMGTESMEDEDHKELLVTDSEVPNFDTHDFRDDITAETSGTNYSVGGVACTGTEWTIAASLMTYDMVDTVYTNVTIPTVMGGVFYFNVGSAATDALILMQDFVTGASATAADFTIQHHTNGVLTLDHVP